MGFPDHGPRPDFTRFRAAWLRHRWIHGVAEEMGLAVTAANYWAKAFRAEGLDLPSKRRKPHPPAVDAQDDPQVIETRAIGDNGQAPIDAPRGNVGDLAHVRKARSLIIRDLASSDDEIVERAMQRLQALKDLGAL